MINHNTILREQLKKIANNMHKKHTTLRKQVIKTAQVFDNGNLPVFPYEVCFGLFRQTIQTASLSSSLQFFPFIQSIINLGFCDYEMSRQILTMLLHTKSIPKFQTYENEIKLQQILNMLISKKTIQLKNMGFVHSLINIYLSLENAKYRTLWTKTTSSLSQITLLLTNQLRQEPSDKNKQQFYNYLLDFIKILNGQKIKWMIQYADIFIIMQMFSQLLDQSYFQQNYTDFEQIFLQIIPITHKQLKKTEQMINSLNSPLKSEPHRNWELSIENKILILLRVAAKINILLRKGYQILQQLIKITTDKKLSIVKHFAYQALNYMFRNSFWMHELLESNYIQLFNFLLTTEFNTIKMVFSENKERVDLVSFANSNENGSKKIMNSNQIDLPSFQFNFSYQVRLIIRHLQQVTDSLYSIYNSYYKIDLQKKMQQKQPLQKIYKFCQKTIFQTIKTIMPRQMSEDLLQSLLKISQKFINLSGCFNDPTVSALYIKMMCKYCLPNEFKNISHRHVQINKMVLNTANCLGHLLTSSCWVIVWKALQNYSIYYNRYLLGKQELQAARQSDVQILYKSMDSIFTQTPHYENIYLLQVLQSLIEVAYQCLENNYNDESRKIFAFERIEQIYRLNLFRINVIWPELSSSLLCITTSKVLYFRLSALNLLNTLIPLSLNYLKGHQDSIIEPLTKQNYQSIILEPWINLVNCQFQQIKDEFIIAVNKLIIDYGHIMTTGWKCILQIVKKTHDLKSLQAIVETFLQKVHDNIMDILMAVDALQRQLHDTNQKYLCLTMIWSIGDYAHKNSQTLVLRKIYDILLVPEQMFNLGTQARHSSFYIFAQIIVHNCAQTSQNFWDQIFAEVKNFYQYGINESIKAKDKLFAEEALKNLLTNLIKVYKKFFLVSKSWESEVLVNKILGQFYLFCEKIIQFRNTQLYQSTIKQTKQILLMKQHQSLQLAQFYQFIQAISRVYYVENDAKILKCLITYLPVQIYDFLGLCINQGLDNHFITLYRVIEKIFLLRLQATQADIKLQQLRIFFQQKYHYQFMKKLNNQINSNKPNLIPLYTENLSKTIHKLQLYNDYGSIFRSLPFLSSTHIKYLDTNNQMILDLMKQLVISRIDQNWLKLANTYKDIPIWYMAIQDLIKIGHQYIDKKSSYSIKVFEFLRQVLLQQIESKLQFLSQEKLSQYYESQLQICLFITENFIFSEQFSQQISNKNVQQIAEFLSKRSQLFTLNDYTKKSLNALNMLFRLSNKKQIYNKVIIQRQEIIIKVLFEKTIQCLQRISKPNLTEDELDQIKHILKKLYDLQINNEILKNMGQFLQQNCQIKIAKTSPIFKSQSGHLIYFQYFFANSVKLKDQELRDIVSCLFLKTSEIILGLQQ